MKVAIFNGSPRAAAGNTHRMIQEITKGMSAAGAEVEHIFLVQKKIESCRGCFHCWFKKPGRCIIDDDMRGLLELFTNADIVTFATPLYVDNVSGLMKNFMDRLLPLLDPHFYKDDQGESRHVIRSGKKLRFLVVSNSGFPEQSHFQVLRLLIRRIARNAQAEIVGEIYRGGGEILRNKNVLLQPLLWHYRKKLQQAGREIIEHGCLSESTKLELEKPIVSDQQYTDSANQWFDQILKKRQ